MHARALHLHARVPMQPSRMHAWHLRSACRSLAAATTSHCAEVKQPFICLAALTEMTAHASLPSLLRAMPCTCNAQHCGNAAHSVQASLVIISWHLMRIGRAAVCGRMHAGGAASSACKASNAKGMQCCCAAMAFLGARTPARGAVDISSAPAIHCDMCIRCFVWCAQWL